ncbi:hypothetical protein M9Y10_000152 [Tritrichomonas musculus]|uniref:Uncharacterized protein n=1 Tax=Tritrichomonas musculus TaxID=1915356 RepID=A0ABR2L6N4_9EUKA
MISNTSKSLLVHPDKSRQQIKPNYEPKNIEEESASVYLLSVESEKQIEKANNSEKSILSEQSKQSTKSKHTQKDNSLISANTKKSIPAHPKKIQHRTSPNNYDYNIEEETASVYMLSNESEREPEKVENSEKSILSEQSKQSTKSKHTKKENSLKSASIKKSIPAHPSKTQQQTRTDHEPINIEEEMASVYMLSNESEREPEKEKNSEKSVLSEQSKQSTKSKRTENENLLKSASTKKSIPAHPNKTQHQPSPNHYNYNAEEETASVYMLSNESEREPEKAENSEKSILSEQSKQSTKSKRTQKENSLKSASIKKSIPAHLSKVQQQTRTINDPINIEEEMASVYMLSNESEREPEKEKNSEKSVLSEQSKQSTKSKRTQKENSLKSASTKKSIPAHPSKTQQQTRTDHEPINIEEEMASVYMLSNESEREPEQHKSEPKKEESSSIVQTPVHNQETPKQPDASSKAKKSVRTSTYDPSIFYTQSLPADNSPKPCPKINYTIKLKVTLKDIGLEGLDSIGTDREENRKSRDGSKSVHSYSLPRQNSSKNDTKTPKQASLLESAQKSHFAQTVKPKTRKKLQ